MNKSFLHYVSIAACALTFSITSPAQASWYCDWFGVGCAPVEALEGTAEEYSATVDQDNPPEVFAFTVSGTFNRWTDIPAETFICDTREREDRTCRYRGYIPEIKRYATVVFKPYAHDLGMYKLRGIIESNLSKDTNYWGSIQRDIDDDNLDNVGLPSKLSVTTLATIPFRIKYYGTKGDEIDWNDTYGHLSFAFKGALK